MLRENELFELLATNLMNIPPCEKDILTVNINDLKQRIPFLNKECAETKQSCRNLTLEDQDDEAASFHLNVTCLAYSRIVQMYQHFVRALDDSNSWPTIIEEVD